MSLAPGTRVGVYEIVGPLGVGGMGEVYRARDPRLGRDVAIKVLPAAFAADPERLQRFEQEARAAAALNHPNILAVHDIGQHAGAPFIVSELLEGETLRERLHGGALPARKAIEYGVQIAQGLAAAHEKGIVHRDLKPENLFVTEDGRVKILDFGLAKLTQVEPPSASLSVLPTAAPDTLPGMVLGTIGYMAPEQVRGHTADHRSDTFALGTILYEILAGQRAFRGETGIDTMTAILKEDPPDLPIAERQIPPVLARIVERCLEKNPAARFQSTRDLAFALESLSSHSESAAALASLPGPRSQARLPWTVAVAASITAITFATLWLTTDATPLMTTRFAVPAPENAFFGSFSANPNMALSPDGRHLAFVAVSGGAGGADANMLWVRSFDSLETRLIAGSEGAAQPFWSPDNRFTAFFSAGQLKKVAVAGGTPETIYRGPAGVGGAWSSAGAILFTEAGRLWQVSSSGGQATAVTALDSASGETSHGYPHFLPDGRRFLYLVQPSNTIRVGALDSAETKDITSADSKAMFTAPGYLLFVRDRTLLAQPFNADNAEIAGDPFTVAQDVGVNETANAPFAVSANGGLVYRSGGGLVGQLVWFDRSGRRLTEVGGQQRYRQIALSPDAKQVAVQAVDRTADGSSPIWLFDLTRGVSRRFTFGKGTQGDPVWSPDGRFIAFFMNVKSAPDLFQKSTADGEESLLLESGEAKWPEDWSRDGRFFAYVSGRVLGVLPLFGDRKPVAFIDTPFTKDEPHFSPDGKWIAYQSDESGQIEVYVQPFPGPGEKVRISSSGGGEPKWRADGRELFYLAPDGMLMAVPIRAGSTLEPGAPEALFATGIAVELNIDQYAVTPDGQRFLVIEPVGSSVQTPITVVLNWAAGLAR